MLPLTPFCAWDANHMTACVWHQAFSQHSFVRYACVEIIIDSSSRRIDRHWMLSKAYSCINKYLQLWWVGEDKGRFTSPPTSRLNRVVGRPSNVRLMQSLQLRHECDATATQMRFDRQATSMQSKGNRRKVARRKSRRPPSRSRVAVVATP